MNELILAIALVCQAYPDWGKTTVQRKCMAEILKCVGENKTTTHVAECVAVKEK